MWTRLLLVAALVGCVVGCGTRGDRQSQVRVNVLGSAPGAVGTTLGLQMYRERCEVSPSGELEDCVDTERATVIAASVDRPDLFQTSINDYIVLYTSLAAGTATITADVDDGEGGVITVSEEVLAAVPDRVMLSGYDCNSFAYHAGDGFGAEFTVSAGDVVLAHPDDLMPFVSDVMTIESPTSGALYFEARSTPSSGTITSPIDASFSRAVLVYDATTLENVAMEPQGQLVLDTPLEVRTFEIVSARRGCSYAFPRTARTLSPDICKISETESSQQVERLVLANGPDFYVRPFERRQFQPCMLEVTIDGTAHVTSATWDVQ